MIETQTRASAIDQVEDAVFEKVIQESLKPLGKVLPALSRIQPADAVQDFPDGDHGQANPLGGNSIEKPGNARLWARPHHFGDNVRV